MHQEFHTITSLIQYALAGAATLGKGVYFVGDVSSYLAVAIAQASGLQVSGYRIAIDHSAIVHTLRKHGQPTEVLQGQLPISIGDIAHLAEWLTTPTRVVDAGQLPGQLHCLRFELSTPVALVVAILEVRPSLKRQQLALKTCYKKRPTT